MPPIETAKTPAISDETPEARRAFSSRRARDWQSHAGAPARRSFRRFAIPAIATAPLRPV